MLGKVDKGLANPELGQDHPAVLQFRYTFNTPFTNMCSAFLKKHEWDAPNRLTTIEKVEQLDEDRVVIYKRHDIYNAPFTSWEQVIINRQNSSIEAEFIGPNPNGTTYTTERTVLRPNLASKTIGSLMDTYIYDVQGSGTSKVEIFKN